MESLSKYLNSLLDLESKNLSNSMVIRNKELSGVAESNLQNRYLIKVTVESVSALLLEHEQYKKFKSSTNLYSKHPENPNIPVKGHYHVVDRKGKKEIYSVNMDGTAHHRTNKGYSVPKGEAEELAKMGVAFKDGNILENIDLKLNESQDKQIFTFWFIVEE